MTGSTDFPPGYQLLVLHQTYPMEGFELVYKGDSSASPDSGLVTAQERSHVFQVVTPTGDFVVEVRYGQLPPQSGCFTVGPAAYEIQIRKKG